MKKNTDHNIAEIIPELIKTIPQDKGEVKYYSLQELQQRNYNIEKFPFSIRILLENILRNYNGFSINEDHLETILNWAPRPEHKEIPYLPARVLMQDFTGVPAVVDIASIRSEVVRKGKDPYKINPQIPVDLIIDHSVQVDYFGTYYALQRNVEMEYHRNKERYSLLKWANTSFENFKVLSPGMGICHQVNLEYLATLATQKDGYIFPDTLVGTDSHTPMINGIGVVGWGVGGIEAEAAMLGQPIYITLPEVIGLKLTGRLNEGTTATDLVLNIAELLRKEGVVGKFVEVFGEGLNNLTVPDRATISNMSPEFGCTVTYFPPDDQTLEYLGVTGRPKDHIATVEKYLKENLLWRTNEDAIGYSKVLHLDLDSIVPSVAGPKRPQDKITLNNVKPKFIDILKESYERQYIPYEERAEERWINEGGHPGKTAVTGNTATETAEVEVKPGKKTADGLQSVYITVDGNTFSLSDGAVVIAAITSCTNTSNPSVMIGAGLIAKNAVEKGLHTKPWVKTSLAPGSRVVTDYLKNAHLLSYLEALGFHVVGYGCTTCIGNSGQLPSHISKAITDNDLVTASVLSGNRNFEARIHGQIKMNFLASPLLVVAYALAGRVDIDVFNEPLGADPNGQPVYLKDIWPASGDIQEMMGKVINSKDYTDTYKTIFDGDEQWNELASSEGEVYQWDDQSSYIKEAPFFKDITPDAGDVQDIKKARVLLKLGDSVTTDHISPAGAIAEQSPAGQYLIAQGIEKKEFNSYGSRRGNHEVMIRGTFANVRLKNLMVEKEGGWTVHLPSNETMPVFDAAMKYQEEQTPLVILAGKEYGSGSSRDWAAKGTSLLGVKAVIAESFERIHRSNLVGMGVLPLQFEDGENAESLGLDGSETFDITDLQNNLSPNQSVKVTASKDGKEKAVFNATIKMDSPIEIEYYKNGGILHYVLREFLRS